MLEPQQSKGAAPDSAPAPTRAYNTPAAESLTLSALGGLIGAALGLVGGLALTVE